MTVEMVSGNIREKQNVKLGLQHRHFKELIQVNITKEKQGLKCILQRICEDGYNHQEKFSIFVAWKKDYYS